MATKNRSKRTRKSSSVISAQIRRLPSGQIQIKIPLKRGESPLAKAQQLAKVLGRKVKSITKLGGSTRNPLDPGLSPAWYRKGRSAGRSKKWADMYDAWHQAKGKPTTPGKRVTAQESFLQGWFDATKRP